MKMGSENENIFRHIQNAVIYSWAGLTAAWDNEMAFRTEVVVIALLMPVGIWIGETAVQWALLIGSSMLVLITELLNSAVEKVVDRIGTEHHIFGGGWREYADRCGGVGPDCL
jgi:diacylglycerol kinase (ATP)